MTEREKLNLTCIIIFIIFLTIVNGLCGCASAPTRQFNSDDTQDYSCYTTFGNELGYCTK